MVQEYKNIAIIGGGASGCFCAYLLNKANISTTIFDFGKPLRTILPTGGGRCNLAHAEYDFKELAKNYPRGERFLYSIFSKFSTYDTIATFEDLSIETYTQEDDRIFPKSNSSEEVRNKILSQIPKEYFVNEKVLEITPLNNEYKIKTNGAEYIFTDVIIANGGHSGFNFIKILDINIIPQKPSLVGLNTKEKFNEISGTICKNVYSKDFKIMGDILFTHFGISGPLTYQISSINARKDFTYTLNFDLLPIEFNFQELLNKNSHKDLKNILSKYLPIKLVKFLLGTLSDKKACDIDGKTRDYILDKIHNFRIEVIGTNRGEETVSAGGIDLKDINPKTLELKKYPHLYCIGEALDIDGFCGGYNLQNAWSTAFVVHENFLSN